MPIDFNRLHLDTDFLIVNADAIIESIYAMLPEQHNKRAFMYILAQLGNDRWFVARWIEIEELARLAGINQVRFSTLRKLTRITEQSSHPLPGRYPKLAHLDLAGLQALLEPVDAVDKDTTSTQEARDLRDGHPARRLVVTSGGQVIGLLTTQTLSADQLGEDVFAHLERSSSAILGVAEDSQSEAAPPVPKGVEAGPPTTGSDDGPESESGPQSEQPKRVFNHWMELLNADGTSTVLDNTIPLKAGSVYELKINVAAPRRTAFEHTSVQAFVDLES